MKNLKCEYENFPNESLGQVKHVFGVGSGENLKKYGSKLRQSEPRLTFPGSYKKRVYFLNFSYFLWCTISYYIYCSPCYFPIELRHFTTAVLAQWKCRSSVPLTQTVILERFMTRYHLNELQLGDTLSDKFQRTTFFGGQCFWQKVGFSAVLFPEILSDKVVIVTGYIHIFEPKSVHRRVTVRTIFLDSYSSVWLSLQHTKNGLHVLLFSKTIYK